MPYFVFTGKKIKGHHLRMMKKCEGEMLTNCGFETVGDSMEFFHHLESSIEVRNTYVKAKKW